MVAVIHSGRSLKAALHYNEQKVKEAKAQCLTALNYPKEAGEMSPEQKLARLQNLAALNSQTKVNCVHVSLNFEPSEKLSEEKLLQISRAYLEKIGFGEQPSLVYQHLDAGHPHLHLVTTNIQPNGRRISLHNLGMGQSEKARKEIEEAFGLVRADARKQREEHTLKPVYAQKVQYGKAETRRAISVVLEAVLNTYKYTSLPELNAVLRAYNVAADRGEEGSRIYQKGGLVYRTLDEEGNKIGAPIKASAFYNKPTLKVLEKKFIQNEAAREPHKARLKNAVDLALLRTKHTLESLGKSLEKEGIKTFVRTNKEGVVYGVTFVDHKSKCVFNGSDLGKAYSAKGLQERCTLEQNQAAHSLAQKPPLEQQKAQHNVPETSLSNAADPSPAALTLSTALRELLQPLEQTNSVPQQQKGAKKEKRKRISKLL